MLWSGLKDGFEGILKRLSLWSFVTLFLVLLLKEFNTAFDFEAFKLQVATSFMMDRTLLHMAFVFPQLVKELLFVHLHIDL